VVLAAATAALTVGGQRREELNTDRASCISAVQGYGVIISDMVELNAPPSTEQRSRLLDARLSVNSGCFRTKIIDLYGDFAQSWSAANREIPYGWDAVESKFPSLHMIGEVQMAFIGDLGAATENALRI